MFNMRRRDFLKNSFYTCCGVAITPALLEAGSKSNRYLINGDINPNYSETSLSIDQYKKLCDIAIETAKLNGASYSDIRICKNRNQRIGTREEQVQYISDGDDFGFGVRVLVNGTWGFAANSVLNEDEVKKITLKACDIAKANSILQVSPVRLADVPSYVDKWKTPVRVNPFDLSINEKIDFQLNANKLAKTAGANFVNSFMWFVNEYKIFASSVGSFIEQDLYRLWARTDVTVIDKESGEFDSRETFTQPIGMGYEYLLDYPYLKDVEEAVEHTKMKLKAPSVTPGKRDIILHPSNLWLTIHETCGHPTELDRALGYEANYAGTSFMTTDKLNNLKYGSEIVNLYADKNQLNGLSSRGYDDDGVKTTEWDIIKNGKFVNYQTTRELAPLVGQNESFACAYGDSWATFPIQRMPNLSLRPGKEKLSLSDLISQTEDGIYIIGDSSWSIDMQRYNFQFTGQEFWEIKNGKIQGMLKDVAYQGNTVDLWNACDKICDESEYELGGSFFCGKGEPGQVAPVSHGSSPTRFRNINILNTKDQI
ncbi:MAG TPA: TldD protein [Bacteroidetes bacterium]|nr:TldD protein [Bacteroidota bacterium]HCN37443.1 TldD protein [Bacteroidota bacterium]